MGARGGAAFWPLSLSLTLASGEGRRCSAIPAARRSQSRAKWGGEGCDLFILAHGCVVRDNGEGRRCPAPRPCSRSMAAPRQLGGKACSLPSQRERVASACRRTNILVSLPRLPAAGRLEASRAAVSPHCLVAQAHKLRKQTGCALVCGVYVVLFVCGFSR